jgi:hypothetical protein
MSTVGEASRRMNSVRNGCGDDCPMLGTPFIRQGWCTAARLGIESGCGDPASMRYDSLQLPGPSECKWWIGESLGS